MWLWGLDPGINHIAATFLEIEDGRREHAQLDIAHRKGAERAEKLWGLAEALPGWLHAQAELHPPHIVWVEQPTGRPNPTLSAAYGLLLASTYGAFSAIWAHPVSILSIEPSTWKKQAIGKGNASREVVHAWARAEGVDHASGDVLDSYGIAIGAALMMQLIGRHE